jgi:hypothetical protein
MARTEVTAVLLKIVCFWDVRVLKILTDPEYRVRNVVNYSPKDTALHPRRFEY